MADEWKLTTEPLRSAHRDHMKVRRFRLTVEDGPDKGGSQVSDGDRVVVGTHEAVDLRLSDRAVSRFHCELSLDSQFVTLTDLASRNGTTVDGIPVLKAPLRDGAVIVIGLTRLRFQFESDHAQIPLHSERFGRMTGVSAATRAAMAQLARAAETDATVLLEGETGTGKEVAAESLHRESKRRDQPFLVVDCGALPGELIEGELFGHEKGAFTGADERRIGVFEAANGGTVLLDEIGELPLALQPKLLRVLENREIKRLGESEYRPVDVRIVAATNRDLRAEVNAQRFRPDLFYRLAVVQIRLPPLRERAADLPMLVEAILADLGMTDHPLAPTLRTKDFLDQLAAHAWAGNVRELRNYLERCLALQTPFPPNATTVATAPSGPEPLKAARDRAMRVFEHAYLTDILARHDGNVSAAARAAGVDRIHFYRMLWRNGLK